jgi:hypothetical protein
VDAVAGPAEAEQTPLARRLTRVAAWLGGTALPFRLVLACYAVAVALNGFLPANLGTWAMLLMFTTLITGASFALVFSGLIVEKIPFTILNVALYLYLFVTVGGSFSIKLGFLADHTLLVVLVLVAAVVLLALLGRIFWRRPTGFPSASTASPPSPPRTRSRTASRPLPAASA